MNGWSTAEWRLVHSFSKTRCGGSLAGGKFGEGGEDEFGLAHVVAQVLGFESFQIFVGIDADAAPFLMDEVGEDGVFVAFLDLVRGQ